MSFLPAQGCMEVGEHKGWLQGGNKHPTFLRMEGRQGWGMPVSQPHDQPGLDISRWQCRNEAQWALAEKWSWSIPTSPHHFFAD